MKYQDAKKIAGVLAAVGEPTRIQVLHHLAQKPHHVGQLAELIGIPMVNMSHHLGVMRQAGLLDDTKDGRRVVYSLREEIFDPDCGPDALGVLTVGTYKLLILKQSNGAAKPKKKGGRKKPDNGKPAG
jgi:DNA-binding transcriptional ArsR family regulator